jgi:ADP-heptose:LPS heptosyltransferase
VHEVEHGLFPLRALGIAAPPATPQLPVPAGAQQRAGAAIAARLPGNGPLIVAHVGAGKRPNIWPSTSFATLLSHLQSSHAARVVLVEGPADGAAVDAVVARLDGALRWRAPLADTRGLFACARLVIANDTGMAHIAAATGAPTLVLFGPTDAQRWRPPGAHVVIVRSPSASIADIRIDTVQEAAVALLEAPAAALPRRNEHEANRCD